MSVDAILWALEQDLPALEKVVLTQLAKAVNQVNGDKHCWPSQKRLAGELHLSRATVNKMIAKLEGRELLKIERRYAENTGYQMSAVYVLAMTKVNDIDLGLSQRDKHPKSTTLTTKVNDVDSYKEDNRNNYRNIRGKTRAPAHASATSHERTNETSNPKKKTGRSKQEDRQVLVPDWLDKGAWQEMIKHRKEMKASMTERAQALMVKKLGALRAEGHDPVELIEAAIMNGWKSVYAPKEETTTNGNGKTQSKPSKLERDAADLDRWYRDRNNGKSWEELQAEHDAVEVDGIRIQ